MYEDPNGPLIRIHVFVGNERQREREREKKKKITYRPLRNGDCIAFSCEPCPWASSSCPALLPWEFAPSPYRHVQEIRGLSLQKPNNHNINAPFRIEETLDLEKGEYGRGGNYPWLLLGFEELCNICLAEEVRKRCPSEEVRLCD